MDVMATVVTTRNSDSKELHRRSLKVNTRNLSERAARELVQNQVSTRVDKYGFSVVENGKDRAIVSKNEQINKVLKDCTTRVTIYIRA